MTADKSKNDNDVLDLQSLLSLIISKWIYFGLSIFAALIVAFLINKLSKTVYEVNTSIIINEESNGIGNASSQLLQDFSFISVDKKFANERIVLRSHPIINEAIEKLNFRVSYFQHDAFSVIELYKTCPFVIILNNDHPQPVGCHINIEFLDNGTYQMRIKEKEVEIFSFVSNQTVQIIPSLKADQINSFNSSVTTNYCDFKLVINNTSSGDEIFTNKTYSFVINKPSTLVKRYHDIMDISPPDLESTVAKISIKSSVPTKTIDFLNSLTESYMLKEISKKQHVALKTIEYIDNQLNNVKDSLQIAENDLQKFRTNNQVIDVSMQSQRIIDEMNNLRNEKANWDVKLKYVNYLQDYFNKNQEYSDLITPTALGINDPLLNGLIEELITLNTEKLSFIENKQENSPYLKKINIRIDNLRNMITENINYIQKTTNISITDIDSRISQLTAEMRKMPKTERELTGIKRIFDINDAIYTYLLEKKSEAEIAKASYQPDSEIIQPADAVEIVSPKKTRNYIIAFFIGFILPIVFLRIQYLLKISIVEQDEVTNLTSLPILGKVYHNNKNTENIFESFPNSHIAESFRKVKLNLTYFLSAPSGNLISINSSIAGEGKSFISLNFAQLLSENKCKTVLVGFDIRRPKVYKLKNLSPKYVGLTTFLSNQADITEIINKTSNDYFDYILAGETPPPNPSELINSPRTYELIDYLKERYDYVIIDTPPLDVVTDAHYLIEKADLKILVVRLNYSPKKVFASVAHELESKKYKACVIINDIPLTKNSKYGYGYYENDKQKNYL